MRLLEDMLADSRLDKYKLRKASKKAPKKENAMNRDETVFILTTPVLRSPP